MDDLTQPSPLRDVPSVTTDTRNGVPELPAGPDYLKEAFRYLCRELDRKQGMIDDLHQIANDNFGMSPEDCDLLTQSVRDRDNLKAATEAIAAVFY